MNRAQQTNALSSTPKFSRQISQLSNFKTGDKSLPQMGRIIPEALQAPVQALSRGATAQITMVDSGQAESLSVGESQMSRPSSQDLKPEKTLSTKIAYRPEETAGHGSLIIQNEAKIQGYIADMPDDFDLKKGQTLTLRCKKINTESTHAEKSIVCLGLDNVIPNGADVDFVALNDKWYKIRSGTAIITKDPITNEQTIEPKGGSASSPYGLHPQMDWNTEKSVKDNLSSSGSVVHEVNKNPIFWSNLPDAIKPAQYLKRLDSEEGIGPLPVPAPEIPGSKV